MARNTIPEANGPASTARFGPSASLPLPAAPSMDLRSVPVYIPGHPTNSSWAHRLFPWYKALKNTSSIMEYLAEETRKSKLDPSYYFYKNQKMDIDDLLNIKRQSAFSYNHKDYDREIKAIVESILLQAAKIEHDLSEKPYITYQTSEFNLQAQPKFFKQIKSAEELTCDNLNRVLKNQIYKLTEKDFDIQDTTVPSKNRVVESSEQEAIDQDSMDTWETLIGSLRGPRRNIVEEQKVLFEQHISKKYKR